MASSERKQEEDIELKVSKMKTEENILTKNITEVNIPNFPKKYANTSPLGLLSFSLTTIFLSFKNVGLYEMNSMIIGMGIFYGGITQFIAGTFEIRKKNTFGGTAFCSYGAFWLGFCTIVCGNFLYGTEVSNNKSTGTFLLFWFVFSAFMFFATLKNAHLTLKLIFASLSICLLLLSIGDYAEKEVVTKIGGYVGLVCGAIALYTGSAEVINEEFGSDLMPI